MIGLGLVGFEVYVKVGDGLVTLLRAWGAGANHKERSSVEC